MAEANNGGRPGASRGCLVTLASAVVLAFASPFIGLVRVMRKWRRGSDLRSVVEETVVDASAHGKHRLDLSLDVPLAAGEDLRRRLTETVVRIAETLRRSDDVYHVVYRLPWEDEPVVMPVGPKLQGLGERFALVQSQGTLERRTTAWLTLPRELALSQVVDPEAYDPESEGEPSGLLTDPRVRWSMATEWARVGPSLIVRMILVVPSQEAGRVKEMLESLT
jgi:CBS domain-containing protein